jgi:hypothetical protein
MATCHTDDMSLKYFAYTLKIFTDELSVIKPNGIMLSIVVPKILRPGLNVTKLFTVVIYECL